MKRHRFDPIYNRICARAARDVETPSLAVVPRPTPQASDVLMLLLVRAPPGQWVLPTPTAPTPAQQHKDAPMAPTTAPPGQWVQQHKDAAMAPTTTAPTPAQQQHDAAMAPTTTAPTQQQHDAAMAPTTAPTPAQQHLQHPYRYQHRRSNSKESEALVFMQDGKLIHRV